MRTLAFVLAAFLISPASFAADQSAAGTNSKLSALLAAKDANGKPIITPEEQAYFNGLNDNLRAQLDDLVQKEVITRPEHLATLLGLQLRPQKWKCSCRTDAFCVTPTPNLNQLRICFLLRPVHANRRRT